MMASRQLIIIKILRHKSESVIINYYQCLLNLFKIEYIESVGSQPAYCLSACVSCHVRIPLLLMKLVVTKAIFLLCGHVTLGSRN